MTQLLYICLISRLHSLFPNYVCLFESLFVPWPVLFLLLFVLYVFVSLLIEGGSRWMMAQLVIAWTGIVGEM